MDTRILAGLAALALAAPRAGLAAAWPAHSGRGNPGAATIVRIGTSRGEARCTALPLPPPRWRWPAPRRARS